MSIGWGERVFGWGMSTIWGRPPGCVVGAWAPGPFGCPRDSGVRVAKGVGFPFAYPVHAFKGEFFKDVY